MELSKIRKYLIANPGTLPIISFQVLIASCALLLIQGNNTLADHVAMLAYYFLLVGIVLQVAKLVKEKHWEN